MGQHSSRPATPTRQFEGTRTTSKQPISSQKKDPDICVIGDRVAESWPRIKLYSSHRTLRNNTYITYQHQTSSWHENQKPVSAESKRLYEVGKILPDLESPGDRVQRRLPRVDSHDQSSDTTNRPHTSQSHSHHPNTKECIVCTDSRSIHHFPSRLTTDQCTHDASVCRRCLHTWIDSQFTTKIWNEISCPVCPSILLFSNLAALGELNWRSLRLFFRMKQIQSGRSHTGFRPG
jgi:hypothetical protein